MMRRIFGTTAAQGPFKDGFHDYLIEADERGNPAQQGHQGGCALY